MSINPGRLLSQLLEWLTVNFRLDRELFSANVHALWTNSSREFFWHLKPIERTSQWVNWLKGCERRGTDKDQGDGPWSLSLSFTKSLPDR
jgi:hypothetical protein